MNQAARTFIDRSAHTAKNAEGYPAARKRPEKSLRKNSGNVGNLVVFKPRQSPASRLETQHAERGIPEQQQASAAPTPINEHMLASSAANHEQRVFSSNDSLPATATLKPGFKQSTYAKVFAGVAVIAIGVTWIAMKSATPEPRIQAPAASDQASNDTGVVAPSTNDQASNETGVATPSADTLDTRPEEEYLDEINWLNDQNHFLGVEVEVLSQEALDLNRQLLDLELELATLSQPAEPDTEPKVVYESVDVPLGVTLSAESKNSAQDSYEQPNLANQMLNHDPNTGFYLNGQFNEGSEAPIENHTGVGLRERPAANQNTGYPPIVPSE